VLFSEWLESKSYHEAAKAVEGDVLGVKRVRGEVSIEVERALLGMPYPVFASSLVIGASPSFTPMSSKCGEGTKANA